MTWSHLGRLSPLALLAILSACGDDDGASPDAGTSPGMDGSTMPGMDAASPGVDGGPLPPPDASTIPGLALRFEEATPEQLGLYVIVERALADGTRATVRYRSAFDAEWREAHPLLRITPDWVAGGAPDAPVDSFAGTIFDLEPGLDYHVEITVAEPGQPDQRIVATGSTRALPPEAGAATRTVAPGEDLQAALDGLAPGDVLVLANGAYDADGLQLEATGTASEPIYVRGESREGVVIRSASGNVLQVLEAAHVVIENLTLEGSGVDSGTDASSRAVSFWNGATQEYVTFRGLDVRGVDMGIVASGPTRGILVYDCDMRGNNTWTPALVESNLTWNDDGVRLPGEGNCAFESTLEGFGDSFAVADGTHSAAVYYYRNRILMTGDDSFEADYGTRNIAFYDNFITNASTLLSLDPLWGGPLYCFRNVTINTVRGPFKLNDENSGFLIYNNTIVRTNGTTDWGWVQFNNGALRAWSFRNNILVFRGETGRLLAVESSGNDPIDFTHNAWYPDGSIWWSSTGGSYDSLDEARAELPATTPLFGDATARHEHDVVIESDPFETAVTLGADHRTEVTDASAPALRGGTAADNAGVPIPNVTDGFAGSAPDMGAVIEGRALPRFGAAR